MTWTKDDFEKVYSRYLESGLSVRDFCFNEGINENRFFYWKKRTITSPEQGLQTPEGAFLPVDVVRHEGRITMRGNGGTGHSKTASGCLCEIRYPNGVVVQMSGNIPVEVYRALVLLK